MTVPNPSIDDPPVPNESYTPDDLPNLLHTRQGAFQDAHGRTILLRGINLSGKQPLDQPSHNASYAFDKPSEPDTANDFTFVGAPFKIEEAELHVSRLEAWGFRAVRLAVAWEALEHAGPGKYDEAYIDFLVDLLRILKSHGFRVFIDPHQDSFSRVTGGSGAPYWALEACGLDPKAFQATQAALVHGNWRGEDGKGELDVANWPDMLWQTNLFRLAALTTFTMFFAGRTYAPKCIIDGKNIQDWLQDHMLDAFGHLADRLAQEGDLLDVCVIGWDSLNEPSSGFIALPDLNIVAEEQTFRKGPTPSLIQTLRMGMGEEMTVDTYGFGMTGSSKTGKVTIDPQGVRCWLAPEKEPGGVSRWGWKRDDGWTLGTCAWALNGVWSTPTGIVLEPDYFSRKNPSDRNSDRVDFLQDHWVPHWRAWNSRIRQAHPRAIAFVNPPVFSEPPALSEGDEQGRVCLSPHYYDGLTLLNKRFHSFNADSVGLVRKTVSKLRAAKFGLGSIRSSMQDQLGSLTHASDTDPSKGFSTPSQGGSHTYPSVIGEIGIPFDMKHDDKLFGLLAKGGSERGYRSQEAALDTSLNATEGSNSLGYFLWGYEPGNTSELGDGWNGEDLSIFSLTDYRTLHPPGSDPKDVLSLLTHGARAVRAFCRPYPASLIGTLKNSEFSIKHATYHASIEETFTAASAKRLQAERNPSQWSEMYVPYIHFAATVVSRVAAGEDQGKIKEKEPKDELEVGKDSHVMSFTRTTLKSHVRLLGEQDPHPSLGLTRFTTMDDSTALFARLDVRFEVTLQTASASLSDIDRLEVICEGQWIRWRWLNETDDDATAAKKIGGQRRYTVTLKRWLGEGGEETQKLLLA